MAARSYASSIDAPPARGVISISINAEHPLNDPAPPSYGTDRDRAASLLRHIELKLTAGTAMERQIYWREMRTIAQRIDANGPVAQTVRERVNDAFARTLGASSVSLTDEQIDAAATISLAQTDLRRALAQTMSAANVDNAVAAVTSRSLRAAANVETEPLPSFANDEATQAATQIATAIGVIYRDTAQAFDGLSDGQAEYVVQPGLDGAPDTLGVINDAGGLDAVSPQKQMDLVNEILRSSLEAQVDAQSNTVDREFGAILDQAVAARLAADAYVREAVAGAGDQAVENAHRFEIMSFIDRAARGETNLSASLQATSMEEQTRRFDELVANNDQIAGSFQFTTDLAAIAQGVIASDMFANYREAIGELAEQAPPQWERFLRDRLVRTESALQRAEIVMASRPQALVMEAWIAYAAAAGNTLPSPDEIKAIATSINASFSRPVVDYQMEKEAICPAIKGVQDLMKQVGSEFPVANFASGQFFVANGDMASRLASLAHPPKAMPDLKPGTLEHDQHKARVEIARLLKGKVKVQVRTREITRRAALRGPLATGLKFPTIAMEGMRYYRAPDAITREVQALAAANEKMPKHRRAAIITTEKKDSKSHEALLKAANAAGFETLTVAVVPTAHRMRATTAEGSRTLTERSVDFQIIRTDAQGAEQRIDLHSAEGQRIARGKILVLASQAQPGRNGQEISASRNQMICWQAIQSVSSKVMVFGDDAQDFNVSQTLRRGVDLGRDVALFDQSGKAIDVNAFYPKAAALSPTAVEKARRDLVDAIDIPLSSRLGELLVARNAGRNALETIMKGADNVKDLVELASTSATSIKDLDSATRATLRETATALGPMLGTLRNPVRLNAAIEDAKIAEKQMNERKLALTTNGSFAEAYNRLAYFAGPEIHLGEDGKPLNTVAIVGGRGPYASSTQEAISASVTELQHAKQVIVTTAEPGVGEMVIRAAVEQNARVVVFAQDHDLSAIRMGLQGDLRDMVDAGRATIVSAHDPGHAEIGAGDNRLIVRTPEDKRSDMLGAATRFADRVVLAAAPERDLSTLMAVEAGQVRPVAVLAPQLGDYENYSANIALQRGNGSVIAEVARGGTVIVPLAEGDISIDNKDARSRAYKDLIQADHAPILRVASWTRPAQVIRSSEALESFVESKRTLRVENGKTMTAAELARHYGLVRDPTAAEIRETNAEIYVGMSQQDQKKLVQQSLEQLKGHGNFRIKEAAGHDR